MFIYAKRPDLFDFEPLDYNTNRGIDIIGRNKSDNRITEGDHWYIELKFLLKSNFNHAFKHLRWIICWDFDKSVTSGYEFQGVEESDVRTLTIDFDDNERPIYLLDSKKKVHKVQIIKLKELIQNELKIEFKSESADKK